MLDIHNLKNKYKHEYKQIMEKWKENPDAVHFLQLLDKTDNCIFLTGKAGTGKSTLIKDVIRFCQDIERPPLVL